MKEEPFFAFDDWLARAERALPDRLRIVLCLDEYERLQEPLDAGWGGAFLDQLRHTLQHRKRFVLMFTGAHTFEEQGPAWTDRFLSARRLRVSFLPREDLVPLLTGPHPDFDLTYAAGALDSLLEVTRGQPFLTQAVACELVDLLNEERRREATVGDVSRAIDKALVSGAEYFANVWHDAGPEGQALLAGLADGDPGIGDSPVRRRLQDRDVLDGAGRFAVPMMQRYVRRKISGP
jgi:uncharacterized protein